MSELPHAKGGRPIFLDSAETDDLLAMVMALAQEVAVLRERCDTTERLLYAKGTLGPTEIDDFRADRAVDEEREAWRRAYLARVLFVIKARADEKAAGRTDDAYVSLVREVGA